ncbi:hypothetical protein FS837_004481 [Tulasnella sp. UAMH 9824]|nr:hypothetical protein FS837_004481 [Tulasnella sp. UAMH 9824]
MSTWKYPDVDDRFDGFRSFKNDLDYFPRALVPVSAAPQDDVHPSPVYEQAGQEPPSNAPWIAAVHLEASPRFTTCTILLLIAITLVAVQYKPAVEQLTSDVAEGVAAASYFAKAAGDCLVGLKVLVEGIANHTADLWCMVVGGSSCIYRFKASMEYAQWLGTQQSLGRLPPPNPARAGRPTPLPRTKELVDGMKRLGELTIDLDTERHSLVAKNVRSDNLRQYGFLTQRFEQRASGFKAKLYPSARKRQDLYPIVLTVARETSGNVEAATRHAQECVRRSQRLRGQSLILLSAVREWMQSLRQAHSSQGLWCWAFGGNQCVPEAEVKEVVASLNELVIAISPTAAIVDQISQQCDQLGSDLVSWMNAFNFTLGMGPDGTVSWQFAKPSVILDTLRDTVAQFD